jgi:hypothetical protein
MTQPLDDADAPFWRRPLPPIQRPAEDTDPLADDTVAENSAPETVDADPLADAPAPESLKNFDAPHANGAARLPNPPANSAPRPVSVTEAQRVLVDSQMRCARATDRQREARGNLGFALERFQRATMQTQTQEQLIRQHIENENQLRADRVAGKIPQRGGERRLGSAVDSFAYHTRATGRGAGGARAFARKAFPPSMRGRVIPKGE